MHRATLLLELGGVILGLGILGRLAGRLGLSAIPLYLLAGLAFGEGGLLPLVTTQEFIEVGAEIGPRDFEIRRVNLIMYAGASGDFNVIHWNERVAKAVGLPDVIAHGMFTMAHLVKAVTDWAGDPGALKRMKVQFRAVVFMDEIIVAKGRVESLDPDSRRARLSVWVEVDRAGERQLPIKNSEAEVELA